MDSSVILSFVKHVPFESQQVSAWMTLSIYGLIAVFTKNFVTAKAYIDLAFQHWTLEDMP